MKYSKIAGAVRWDGGMTILSKGQSIDEDHPLVEERPDLFTDEEPTASLPSGRIETTRTGGPGTARTERPRVVQAPPRKPRES